MTNPATEPMVDGTPDPDASFLADFESTVMGKDTSYPEPERSSAVDEDADASAPADTPTAPVDADTPSDPVAPRPDAAAIQSSVPLEYTINGESRAVDWALRVGDEGVVIPPQHIARLQDLIQRDEWQNTQNRDLYAKTQQYEALTHTVNETEYRGAEAFRQLQAEKTMLDVSGAKLLSSFADPTFVTNLALAYQSNDPNEVNAVLSGMIQQVQFAGQKAQFEAIREFAQKDSQVARQQVDETTQNAEYVGIVRDFGKALPELTPDDLKAMHDHFHQFRDRIFRPATMQEAQQLGVRAGSVIKDPTIMHNWATERAMLRQQSAASLAAAQKAGLENAARQNTRVPTTARRATSPSPVPVPSHGNPEARFPGDDGTYAAWKRQMEAGRFTGVQDDS